MSKIFFTIKKEIKKWSNVLIPIVMALNVITVKMDPSFHHIFSYGFLLTVALKLIIGILENGFRNLRLNSTLFWFFAIVVWSFISASFSEYPEQALLSASRLALFFGVIVGLYNCQLNNIGIRNGIYALFVVGGAVAISILVEVFKGRSLIAEHQVVRYAGIIESPNIAGFILASVLIVALYIQKDSYKISLIGLLLLALVLTYARAAWVMAVVGLSLFVFFQFRHKIKSWHILAFMLFITISLFIFWDELFVLLRLGDGLVTHRDLLWKAGLHIFWDFPVFGVGSGNLVHYLEHYLQGVEKGSKAWEAVSFGSTHAHSMFISIAAELGIVGFLLSVGLILNLIVKLFRVKGEKSNLQAVAQVLMVGFLLRSFFESGGLIANGWLGLDIILWFVFLGAIKEKEEFN